MRTTDTLLTRRAVAMPEPIKPPPIMATFFIFLGFSPISVTPGIYNTNIQHEKELMGRKKSNGPNRYKISNKRKH